MMARLDITDLASQMTADRSIDPGSGAVVFSAGSCVNFIPFPVVKGCRVMPAGRTVRIRLFFYSREIPEELIHTYCYQDESNWASYRPELSNTELDEQGRIMPEDGFIRVSADPAPRGCKLSDLLVIENNDKMDSGVPFSVNLQAERLSEKVKALRKPGDLVLMVLTDTHYTVNGIWPDTLKSLRICAEKTQPDAVVHLGDFTDGLLPGEMTRGIVSGLRGDLEDICGRLWCCVGNHDVNYFRNNPDRFTRGDCASLYLRRKNPWYFVDLPEKELRLLFLDSFDPNRQERYGFPAEELVWMEKTLSRMPASRRAVIFSHVPPASEIHVWSRTIRNGEAMLRTVERFHKKRGGAVIAWIHGHNHADQVYRKRAFPIIGIGCSKLEDFKDHKPAGSLTFDRVRGTDSQELWDLVLIHPLDGSVDFLRYGAGFDRHVEMRSGR